MTRGVRPNVSPQTELTRLIKEQRRLIYEASLCAPHRAFDRLRGEIRDTNVQALEILERDGYRRSCGQCTHYKEKVKVAETRLGDALLRLGLVRTILIEAQAAWPEDPRLRFEGESLLRKLLKALDRQNLDDEINLQEVVGKWKKRRPGPPRSTFP